MGVSIWEGDKAERVANALEVIAMNGAGSVVNPANNWPGAVNLIRRGLGRIAYPIGSQFRVEKESSMTATLGKHTGVTAVTVNEETFLASEGIVGSGVHEFTYDGGAWRYEGKAVSLTAFGLTVTGTPAEGDEIIVTEKFDNLLFDVADHGYVDPVSKQYIPASKVTDETDKSHPAMALLMHHCINGRAVSVAQALYGNTTDAALPAGTYCFTIATDSGQWTAGDYQFTLTQDLPIGGQLKISGTNEAPLVGQKMNVYASPLVTAITESVDITAGSEGTNLGILNDTLNQVSRMRYGSNYANSQLHLWLNSAEAANNWLKAVTPWDRPVGYANVAGFMHGLDADFLAAVREVNIPCRTNSTYEMPGIEKDKAFTLKGRFFLPSRDELGYGVERIAEGGVWELYNGATAEDRIKRDLAAQSTARRWWMRSPSPGNSYYVRTTHTAGTLNDNCAIYGLGAAPACIIY